MFEGAIGTALCFILFFLYFDIKKIAGLAFIVDAGVFVLFLWMFQGTHTGMMTGVLASVFISGFLFMVRRTVGCKKMKIQRMKGQTCPMPRWTNVPGKFS